MPAPFWLRSGFDAPPSSLFALCSQPLHPASSRGSLHAFPTLRGVLPLPQEGGFLVVRSLFVASGQGSNSSISPCFPLASSRRRDMPFPAPPAPLPALRRVRTASRSRRSRRPFWGVLEGFCGVPSSLLRLFAFGQAQHHVQSLQVSGFRLGYQRLRQLGPDREACGFAVSIVSQHG